MPNVGAVMPVFNHEPYVAEAIDSVVPQVERLVVVDDGSTDGCKRYLEDRAESVGDITLMRHLINAGTGAAINTGIELLKDLGEFDWWTWVSSDNIHRPPCFQRLMDTAGAAEDVGVVYSGFQFWIIKNNTRRYHFKAYTPQALISGPNSFFGPSFIVRPEVWVEHRGHAAHDYDMWTRVEEACWERGLQILSLNEDLCVYRSQHPHICPKTYDAKEWNIEARKRRGLHAVGDHRQRGDHLRYRDSRRK